MPPIEAPLFPIEKVMEWHSDRILDAAERTQHFWNENVRKTNLRTPTWAGGSGTRSQRLNGSGVGRRVDARYVGEVGIRRSL
jgi:hypothetical protein